MDSQLLELFPGRTLEELDEMDIARLDRALAARQVAREWRHDKGYINGEHGVLEFDGLPREKRQEIYAMWQEIEDAKRQSD